MAYNPNLNPDRQTPGNPGGSQDLSTPEGQNYWKDKESNNPERTTGRSKLQTISVTDLISEGPIQGLVSGTSSVYLDDDRQAENTLGPALYNKTPATFTIINDTLGASGYWTGHNYGIVTVYNDQKLVLNDEYSVPHEHFEDDPSIGRFMILRDFSKTPVTSTTVGNNRNGMTFKITSTKLGMSKYKASGYSINKYRPCRLVDSEGFELTGWLTETDPYIDEDNTGTVDSNNAYFHQGYYSNGVYHKTGNTYGHFKDTTNWSLYRDQVIAINTDESYLNVTLSSGSTTVTHTACRRVFPGMKVTGYNIQEGTTVASVTNTTTFELSKTATATTASRLTFTGGSYDAATKSTTYVYHISSFGTERWDGTVSGVDHRFDGVADVDTVNNTLTVDATLLNYGDAVTYESFGTAVPGLEDGKVYYVIKVNDTTIKLANTKTDAADEVVVGITGTGTVDAGVNGQRLRRNVFRFDDLGYAILHTSTGMSWKSVDSSPLVRNEGTQVQFRIGNLVQPPFTGEGGLGSTAVTTTINKTSSTEAGPILLEGTSSTGFNLSPAQIQEVDELRVRFNYPAGLHIINADTGEKAIHKIRYKFVLGLKRHGSTNYSTLDHESWEVLHTGAPRARSLSFDSTINLEPHRPFDDFRLSIERLDTEESPGWNSDAVNEKLDAMNTDNPSGLSYPEGTTNVSQSQVSTVTSIFKEKMINPLTALAKVSYSSSTYKQLPSRSYHCKGMLVKVPSNYVTRDESTTGTANYNRDSVTGLVRSTYQDWDGSFRSYPVYTNNPAWIFYDILTNNRYGLGDFMSDSDIDKYALYRIGRYCDEEVDDGSGTGSTEPRYTMNTYIQKSSDAFKVLKDMASNFLAMIYYLDGQIHPVQDSPAGPIYAFSKGNVLGGSFKYESTGSKTRANQVVVSWNDPASNYKLEPLIVEDRRNIAETGAIITQSAVAYGCTSEGQATRYGKWKLWTAANQQELVSFSTGINGAYITPGDLILVQDADRHATRYSGRISSSGTLSTTQIPLDSSVVLNEDSTYELGVIIQGYGAFVAEDVPAVTFTVPDCVTSGTTTVTCDVSNIRVGMSVNGTGISDLTVVSVNPTGSFVLSSAASGSGTVDLQFTSTYSKGDFIRRAYITQTFDASDASIVDLDTADESIKIPSHGYNTRDLIIYSNGGGTSIGNLTSGTTYYAIRVDDDHIRLATSAANATNGTKIDLNALGVGTSHSVTGYLDIDSSERAANAKSAASGADAILLNWKKDFRVETQPVSTSHGTVTALTVSAAFESAPAAEDIWVLTETTSAGTVAGSGKEYRVLSISQNSQNQYDITAAEHYNEKYTSIEEDFTTYVAEVFYPPVRADDVVPPPRDVWAYMPSGSGGALGDTVSINWSMATAGVVIVRRDTGEEAEESITTTYKASGVEITHNFPNQPNPVFVPYSSEFSFRGVPNGNYKVAVRTVNTIGNKSMPKIINVKITQNQGHQRYWPGIGAQAFGKTQSNVAQEVTQ